MKLSKIYSIAWLFIGISLAFMNWGWTTLWVVSGLLNGLSEYQYKKETKPKKITPSYVK